jgi:hypothetical protein
MSTRRLAQPDRRAFLGTLAAAAVAANANAAPAPAKRKIALGFDNFSIRALGWKASRMVEYAGQQRVDVVLFSDLDVFESLEDAALRELKAKADGLGVALQVGTGSLCPTSSAFDKRRGTPDEHLALLAPRWRGATSARRTTGVAMAALSGISRRWWRCSSATGLGSSMPA